MMIEVALPLAKEHIMSIERRLESLERRLGFYRNAFLSLLALFTVVILTAAHRDATPTTHDVVRTRRIEIVDGEDRLIGRWVRNKELSSRIEVHGGGVRVFHEAFGGMTDLREHLSVTSIESTKGKTGVDSIRIDAKGLLLNRRRNGLNRQTEIRAGQVVCSESWPDRVCASVSVGMTRGGGSVSFPEVIGKVQDVPKFRLGTKGSLGPWPKRLPTEVSAYLQVHGKGDAEVTLGHQYGAGHVITRDTHGNPVAELAARQHGGSELLLWATPSHFRVISSGNR